LHRNSQRRGLTQFGINIKGAADGTLDLTTGLNELRKASDAVGGSFGDAQAKINVTKVAWDTLKDSVGEATDKLIDFYLKYNAIIPGISLKAKLTPGAIATPFGPQPESAAERQFREEQERRSKEANQKIADDKLKAEQDLAEKVKTLNEQNAQELIKTVADVYEVGTNERLDLELALNDKLRQAAIDNALAIGADVEAVRAIFREKDLKAQRDFVNAVGAGPAAGSGGEDPDVKAHREMREKQLEIDLQWAAEERQIEEDRLQWLQEAHDRQVNLILDAASSTAHSLSAIFAKNKAFAIGSIIVDTAIAAMKIWRSDENYYVKIAQTIALAAFAHAQLQQVRSASVDGGGGISGSGGGVASSPTAPAAAGSGAAPPAFTAGGNFQADSMSVAPMSQRQFNTVAGNASGGFYAPRVTIVIDKAFGDDRAMNKLTREIQRKLANQQWALR
jgi:hypothetical protein